MIQSWKSVKLGEIADFEGGSQPPKATFVDQPKDGHIRLLQIRDFKSDHRAVYIPNSKKNRTCQADDIMIGRYGASVGQILRGKTGAYNVALIKTKPNERIVYKEFFYLYLISELFQKDLLSVADRSAQAGFSKPDIAQFKVPLPPLPEQKRIVAILDEAFEGIDTAVANTEKNLANVRGLFESYLNSVFSQGNDYPIALIGEVGTVFDGPHATPKTVDAGPIFLGISALQDGEINLGETRHVTPEDFQRWTRRVKPEAGDVVFSYETRLGQVAIIPEGLECCLGRRMGLVRTNRRRIIAQFFVYQYMSPLFRRFLDGKIVRGATVDRIALKEFPSFPLYLPDITEQQHIVNRINLLRAETQRLESIYQQKLNDLAKLKQAILHKAFSGELTAHPEKALQEAAE